jgi:hypothetical protein
MSKKQDLGREWTAWYFGHALATGHAITVTALKGLPSSPELDAIWDKAFKDAAEEVRLDDLLDAAHKAPYRGDIKSHNGMTQWEFDEYLRTLKPLQTESALAL